MKITPTCLCDKPQYLLILGKFYCAFCVFAFRRVLPGYSGFTSARMDVAPVR